MQKEWIGGQSLTHGSKLKWLSMVIVWMLPDGRRKYLHVNDDLTYIWSYRYIDETMELEKSGQKSRSGSITIGSIFGTIRSRSDFNGDASFSSRPSGLIFRYRSGILII